MVGGSTLVLCHCRRVLFDAVQWRDTFVSVTFIPTLIWFITVVSMNGDKFDFRKSMWAADEKVIINNWGLIQKWNNST